MFVFFVVLLTQVNAISITISVSKIEVNMGGLDFAIPNIGFEGATGGKVEKNNTISQGGYAISQLLGGNSIIVPKSPSDTSYTQIGLVLVAELIDPLYVNT